MQNPSRRAFFGGKAPEISRWDQLLLQLQRKTQGKLILLEQEEQAVFRASILTDLHYARQLCHAFGISLYLWEGVEPEAEAADAIIWLDMTALNQLMPIDPEKNQWFMQAGVCMSQLKEVGFDQVLSLPNDLTVANWLANPYYHSYSSSQLPLSGLVHASLLTADGSVNSLGMFGAQNTKPLNTPFLRQLVPQLFQLATTESAQVLLDQPNWFGRYRLDTFNPRLTDLNLAHLLLGHGGDLGVLEWVVIDKRKMKTAPPASPLSPTDTTLQIAAQELDSAVKQFFDPDGLFSFSANACYPSINAVPQHVYCGANE